MSDPNDEQREPDELDLDAEDLEPTEETAEQVKGGLTTACVGR